MNRMMVRRDSPAIVALSNPKNERGARTIWAGWAARPKFWVDDVDGAVAGPVEKTAGSRTSATPQSTPRVRRRMIRERVNAQPSFCLASFSLPHE